MTELTYRRTLFVALLLAAPALVFLVQVVFVVTPAVVLAGTAYMMVKAVARGFRGEDMVFVAFFLGHLLVFVGLYYFLAWVCGKIARRVPDGWPRRGLLAVSLAGLLWATQQPLYGGGGHGPGKMGPLQDLLADLGKTYGVGATAAVAGAAVALALLPAAKSRWRRRKERAPA